VDLSLKNTGAAAASGAGDRAVAESSAGRRAHFAPRTSERGWTLLELVIVVTVLTIMTMGVIPIATAGIKRQKEYRLREALREMREAIREFHRDTIQAPCCVQPGAGGAPVAPGTGGPPTPPGVPGAGGSQYLDPRSKVAISDRTIFDTTNLDHYPPTLQALVDGVNVVPRLAAQGAVVPNISSGNATEGGGLVSLRKKIYLIRIPDDPMTPENESTGEAEWGMRSCYDEADSSSWDGVNVFDVYSKSEGTALNGEKYSDW
jgi:general secretion pathway protein G